MAGDVSRLERVVIIVWRDRQPALLFLVLDARVNQDYREGDQHPALDPFPPLTAFRPPLMLFATTVNHQYYLATTLHHHQTRGGAVI